MVARSFSIADNIYNFFSPLSKILTFSIVIQIISVNHASQTFQHDKKVKP
jgi:hypothetical protein